MRRPLILLLLSLVPAVSAAAETEPLWPLELETRYLTSNFMEHRGGRFHAGLDFKTRSRTGYPVRAVEDGWISRIRFSTGGYGKALYLRGDSGRTYVYAHLERLADRWRPQVRRTQARRGRYDVVMHFPASKHAVRRGEILALSGQTGTAGPHLHFEVRDAANRPLDPQAHGFAVPDTIAPRILQVRVLPAAPGARVEGETVARTLRGEALSGRLPRLRVAGPVAFTARVVEVSDLRGHRLEPYRLAVSLDDSLVFESRNEAYAFADQHQMRLEWLQDGGPPERWLHRRPGNGLPGRVGEAWSLDPAVLTPGEHVVRLVAEDRAGNRAEASWTVLNMGAGHTEPPRSAAGWDADPVRIEWRDPDGGAARWRTPFIDSVGDTLRAARPGGEDLLGRGLHVVAPDTVDAAARRRAVRAQGLHDPLWAARVLAADWTSSRAAVCELDAALPDTLPQEAGVYLAGRRGWSWAGRPERRDGGWRFEAGGPGRYALFADRNAPYLGPGPDEGIVRPAAPSDVDAVSAPTWEILTIRAEDRGAGLDLETLQVRLDGRPLIAEPDPPRDRLLVELPDDLPAGSHTLEIAVSDRAGHVVERSYALELVATP